MTPAPGIKGWCPGALRPMLTGDGFLVRLKFPGGRLTPQLAQDIAALGRRFGNGAFDLTQRANLQIRGVRESDIPAVQAALDRLGLLPQDAASEQMLNIIGAPLAGCDPTALINGGKLLADLETLLKSDVCLQDLPGKFGFAIDDGGALSNTDAPADIRLEAAAGEDGVKVALRLAGGGHDAALVSPEEAALAAGALAGAFLDRRKANPALRRMRHAVAAHGAATIFADAGLSCAMTPARAPAPLDAVLGVHAINENIVRLGLAAPYGRWSHDDLDALANACRQHGVNDLRLTHWRVILLLGLTPQRMKNLIAALAERRFITAAGDARLAIVACPGAPACASASIFTRDAADDLARHDLASQNLASHEGALSAQIGNEPIRIHISGCQKGCAHPRPAPFTLVGRNGAFDLVADGPASAPPIAQGLNVEQARCEIARRMAWLAAS